VWMLITVSCWFYTLFLFDALGDAKGFDGAYWVLIVMPMMPLVLYVIHRIVLVVRAVQQQDRGASVDSAAGESTFNVLRSQMRKREIELTQMQNETKPV